MTDDTAPESVELLTYTEEETTLIQKVFTADEVNAPMSCAHLVVGIQKKTAENLQRMKRA